MGAVRRGKGGRRWRGGGNQYIIHENSPEGSGTLYSGPATSDKGKDTSL